MKLYTYHRNSAGERVRIALNLKGLTYAKAEGKAGPHAAAREPASRAIRLQTLSGLYWV